MTKAGSGGKIREPAEPRSLPGREWGTRIGGEDLVLHRPGSASVSVPETKGSIRVRTRERVDRDEAFLEVTRSVCPVCRRVVDAEVNARDGQVFLRKRCPEHGSFEARVYGDATMYVEAMRFNKPGTIPLETQTEVRDGCPLDCGLCPDHKQHACLGVIEVNSACNLDCPICFADSGHQPDGFTLTRDQV